MPLPASQRSPVQPAWQMHFPECWSQTPWWQLQFCSQPSLSLHSEMRWEDWVGAWLEVLHGDHTFASETCWDNLADPKNLQWVRFQSVPWQNYLFSSWRVYFILFFFFLFKLSTLPTFPVPMGQRTAYSSPLSRKFLAPWYLQVQTPHLSSDFLFPTKPPQFFQHLHT